MRTVAVRSPISKVRTRTGASEVISHRFSRALAGLDQTTSAELARGTRTSFTPFPEAVKTILPSRPIDALCGCPGAGCSQRYSRAPSSPS